MQWKVCVAACSVQFWRACVSNPVIAIIINKSLCSHSHGFIQTWSDFLAEFLSAELSTAVQLASLLGFEKGLCVEWVASSSSSFPVSPPHFPGLQTLRHGDTHPPLPLALTVSLKACCYWYSFLCQGRVWYDLVCKACMHGSFFFLRHPHPPTSFYADVILRGFLIHPSPRPSPTV